MSRRGGLWSLVLLAAGCGPGGSPVPPLPLLPFRTDTLQSVPVGPGVTRYYLYVPSGPWAIHVLRVALDRCTVIRAVKGFPGAAGRETTLGLLQGLPRSPRVAGGVNADFFLFVPPGVPTGALIAEGRVITGPSAHPVFAIDSAGTPRILVLGVSGLLGGAGFSSVIAGWNRAAPTGLAVFDEQWGPATDTASAAIEVAVDGASRVRQVDTAISGVLVPAGGRVLLAGRDAPAGLRAWLRALHSGDSVALSLELTPFHPIEAVGGRPILVLDSTVTEAVQTEGQPGFATGRHPRTAIGIARGGRELVLAVVDGRQAPYSDGMTLGELADLMLALGTPEALNLDGGGSTTMVAADGKGVLRIINRPSDKTGPRPVGDALAIVRQCRGS